MNYKIVPALTFDFLTPFYNTLSNIFGYGFLLKRKVLGLIHLKKNESFLDIGCGSGLLAIMVKKQFPDAKIYGIDADQKILKIAEKEVCKNNLKINLRLSHTETLPFPDNSFNLVVSTLVFHHLPTEVKKKTMKEIFRVLKENGMFLLVDLGKNRRLLQKIFYFLIQPFEEAKYMQDNIQGKLSIFLMLLPFS